MFYNFILSTELKRLKILHQHKLHVLKSSWSVRVMTCIVKLYAIIPSTKENPPKNACFLKNKRVSYETNALGINNLLKSPSKLIK